MHIYNIHQCLIVLCLLVIAVPSQAKAPVWVEAASGHGYTTFLDLNNITRNGNLTNYWEIQNLPERDEKGVASRKSLNEVDCETKKNKILSITSYSERSGKGSIISSFEYPNPMWQHVIPGSLEDVSVEFLCSLNKSKI